MFDLGDIDIVNIIVTAFATFFNALWTGIQQILDGFLDSVNTILASFLTKETSMGLIIVALMMVTLFLIQKKYSPFADDY